jgi:pyruvate/2-oxoglutarate dehydrogenase complex dihydrolipoamide acyltransferase (E2) component
LIANYFVNHIGGHWNGKFTSALEAGIVTTLKVPKAGGIPTTKANVVRWLKQVGDSVKVGEPVVELETEKVSYELESPAEGVLLKILAQENSLVPVGEPLCQIG